MSDNNDKRTVVAFRSPLSEDDAGQLIVLIEDLITTVVKFQGDRTHMSLFAKETTDDIIDTLIDIKVDLKER